MGGFAVGKGVAALAVSLAVAKLAHVPVAAEGVVGQVVVSGPAVELAVLKLALIAVPIGKVDGSLAVVPARGVRTQAGHDAALPKSTGARQHEQQGNDVSVDGHGVIG